MAWMQSSTLGHLMRESGLWTYAVVNLSHILGIASLFGAIAVLDLRLLGAWRHVPISLLADAVVPIATFGFVLAATTGLGLLATKATEYTGNPFLYIKLAAVALGAINGAVLSLTPAWRARRVRDLSDRERRQLAWMGGASLGCWLTAIGAGRLIAYW